MSSLLLHTQTLKRRNTSSSPPSVLTAVTALAVVFADISKWLTPHLFLFSIFLFPFPQVHSFPHWNHQVTDVYLVHWKLCFTPLFLLGWKKTFGVLPGVYCLHPAKFNAPLQLKHHSCLHLDMFLCEETNTSRTCKLCTLKSTFLAGREREKIVGWWVDLAPSLCPPLFAITRHPLPDTRHLRPLPFNIWCLQVVKGFLVC